MVPMWQTLVETVGERTPTSPGTQLLDLASGPGNPSLQLAKALPGLAVRCTDASDDMVEKAKGRQGKDPLPPFASFALEKFGSGWLAATICLAITELLSAIYRMVASAPCGQKPHVIF